MGLLDDTDESWSRWAELDPYFAVLSNDSRFRRAEMTPERTTEFLRSGEETIAAVLHRCAAELHSPALGRALDFGSGVGRLVLPLARRFDEVVGVDIAPGMRAETQRNAAMAGLTNVSTAGGLDFVEGQFDFIHSVLVFQHIPTARGLLLIEALLDRLSPGGIAAIHVPLTDARSAPIRAVGLARRLTPLNGLVNILRGRAWSEPLMRMYSYDANAILLRSARHGITRTAVWTHGHPRFPHAYFIMSNRALEGPAISAVQEEC
jgi:SAM-dependent methyltransferase